VSSTDASTAGHRIVIAIDGPAASGKSSTAQWVARELGLRHVDSGSLYRAATLAALRASTDVTAWTANFVGDSVRGIELQPAEVSFTPFLNGQDVTADTRSIDVTRHVSRVAQMPSVREWVNRTVQDVARNHDVVVDGRDMGTAVFPRAVLKVFLVADPWERARRRLVQRLERSPTDDEIALETEWLVRRDAADATQTVQARDAVLLDTTFLTQEQQVERIVALAKAAVRDPLR
jgi:cytidylate kinase